MDLNCDYVAGKHFFCVENISVWKSIFNSEQTSWMELSVSFSDSSVLLFIWLSKKTEPSSAVEVYGLMLVRKRRAMFL